MAQSRIVVGTSPILIAQDNPERSSLNITMLPSSSEAGNSGQVHVQKGAPPSSEAGSPTAGDVLTQGTSISDVPQFAGDPSLWPGQWWAVADTAGQIIVVDETT